MACSRRRTLSSDPDYLLSLMAEVGDESDSEDDFDGWLGEDDGPTIVRSRGDVPCSPVVRCSTPLQRRSSMRRSLSENSLDFIASESPIPQCSPAHSPMQLSANNSPALQPRRTAVSPSHSPLLASASLAAASPIAPPIFTATTGIIPDTNGLEPVDYFRLIFDDRVIDLIFTETNRYASQFLEQQKEHLERHPKARAHEWEKTKLTKKEIEAFLGLLLAMGICGFPTLR